MPKKQQLIKSLSITDRVIRFVADKRIQLLFVVAIVVSFYGNSINNNFAFDDQQFYSANQFVLKGVAGIHDIVTKDYEYGFYSRSAFESVGRWRPLSPITFAIEKEYFNADPHISHFINMLLLAVTGIIMLLFSRKYVFKSSPVAAFMVALLFVIHPVHTEAVSHIKSRDELLSWLFLLLTFYCSLNFLTKRNYWQLALSLIFYFLALLSKENGIMFIAILPLTFYFFTTEKFRTIVFTTLSFVVVLGGYALIRFSFVPFMSKSINNVTFTAYLYATHSQHIATVLMLLGKYILLLFWPNPLSCDYSYNSIPYVNFSDWRVWLSIAIQAILILYALLKLKEKKAVSYGILFYFSSIFIVSNLVINVGPIFGERFLYQASFGFCIAIVATTNEALMKIKFKSAAQKFSVISVLITILILLSGFQTIQRNTEWNNNMVLFKADVKKVPNSFLVHESLGNILMNEGISAPLQEQRSSDFIWALGEYDTASTILPKDIITRYNIGDVYTRTGNSEQAIKAFLKCIDLDSTYSQAYSGLGSVYYYQKNYEQALNYFKKSSRLDSLDALPYFDIGLCYHMLGQYEEEIQYYRKTLSLNLTAQEVEENSLNMQTVRDNLINAENLLQTKK